MKKKAKKKNAKFDFFKTTSSTIVKLIVILFIMLFLSKHKALIIVIVFEVLDLIKNMIRQNWPYIPLMLLNVLGISYFFILYSISHMFPILQ